MFDEASVMEPHATRGWMQKSNLDFVFHHRYCPRPNAVHLNRLGQHDSIDYEPSKPKETIRVALFGCTTLVGYELAASSTIGFQLKQLLAARYPTRRFEVMNAAVRNYTTSQLYHWYIEVLADYHPDLVIYVFNTNHPRRNITFHESGKPALFHQPVYEADEDGHVRRLDADPPRHPNDMLFLNERGEVERHAGKTMRNPHRWLSEHVPPYRALEDFFLGSHLRKLDDRVEIKDIEKQTASAKDPCTIKGLPYQWQATAGILRGWAAAVRKARAKFLIVPILAFYHAGEGRLYGQGRAHPLGFAYESIPERRSLPIISRALGIPWFDTYRFAREQRIDLDGLYIHPRYAYFTPAGAAFQAKAIAVALEEQGLLGEVAA